jgi:hypothetical protein
MPTYTNTSLVAAPFPSVGMVAAGGSVATLKYLTDVPTGFELTAHTPYPKIPVLKFGDAPPSGAVTGLAGHAQIRVFNNSGADATVIINDDDANALIYPHGVIDLIENDRDIEQIEITGSGTGDVYVWGVPR